MTEWNAGGKPAGRWDHTPKSDAEERAIQRGIDATMREVIRNPYNPHCIGSMADTPKPRGTGWAKETPITSPPGMDLIKNLVDHFQPHGVANAANPLSKVVEEAVEKFKAQGAQEKPKGERLSGLLRCFLGRFLPCPNFCQVRPTLGEYWLKVEIS
jgi:hypothetical protein